MVGFIKFIIINFTIMGKEETFFMLAVGNGTTWGRLKPNTKIQKNNIQKILDFYPRFESAPG